MQGAVRGVAKGGVCRLALATWRELRRLCARSGSVRRRGTSGSAASKPGSEGLADRSRRPLDEPGRGPRRSRGGGPGGAPRASGLGRPQDRRGAGRARAWRRRRRLEHDHADPAPARRLDGARRRRAGRSVRFEHAAAQRPVADGLQGPVRAGAGGRCHPLTVLDDHSRFALGLGACGDEQEATVRGRLTALFRRYGLPWRILCDNGSPWGDGRAWPQYSRLGVWLMRPGHRGHPRPALPSADPGQGRALPPHAQGRGARAQQLSDLVACQRAFDRLAADLQQSGRMRRSACSAPARRYRPSPRVFSESLPPIEYGPGDIVRKVDGDGWISFRNRPMRIGKAFRRQPVALRPGSDDGVFDIHYCVQRIGRLDLRALGAPACGVVDIARAMPTTPQAPQQNQVRERCV